MRPPADDRAVNLRIRGAFGAEHEDATVGAQVEPRARIHVGACQNEAGKSSHGRFSRHNRIVAETAIGKQPHAVGRSLVIDRHEGVGARFKNPPRQG